MKRIHVPKTGPDHRNVPLAIAIGLRECQALATDLLTIITPAKNNLDSIIVGEFLGRDASKRLMKGETVRVDHGVRLAHESVTTVQKRRTPRVAIAFHVSADAIRSLDGLAFDCLIFVPWLDQEGEEWAKKWDAETHGRSTVGAAIDLPTNVVESLRHLTAAVNLSTGLGHPSDLALAKQKFSELKVAETKWAPAEVEKWAVRNGWRSEHAHALAEQSARYTSAPITHE